MHLIVVTEEDKPEQALCVQYNKHILDYYGTARSSAAYVCGIATELLIEPNFLVLLFIKWLLRMGFMPTYSLLQLSNNNIHKFWKDVELTDLFS